MDCCYLGNKRSDSGRGTQDSRADTGSYVGRSGSLGYFGCLAKEASDSGESDLGSGTEDDEDLAALGTASGFFRESDDEGFGYSDGWESDEGFFVSTRVTWSSVEDESDSEDDSGEEKIWDLIMQSMLFFIKCHHTVNNPYALIACA